MEALQKFLSKPKIIKIQILFYLFVARASNHMRKYHKERYVDDIIKDLKPDQSESIETKSSELCNDRPHRWWNTRAWEGVPKVNRKLKAYGSVSTLWMIYVVLRNTFSLHKFVALINPSDIQPHCLLVGKLVLDDTYGIQDRAATLLAAFHLAWRLSQKFLFKCYTLNFMVFMLQDDRDLKRFYTSIDEQNCYRRSHTTRASKDLMLNVELDVCEVFLRELMCYPIKRETETLYILRPNRTAKSRRDLRTYMGKATAWVLVPFVAFSITFGSYVISHITADITYIARYPRCFPLLEQLHATGNLDWHSVTLKNHHFVSFVADFLENIIIWLDSAAALSLALMNYVIQQDLLVYWHSINEKLQLTSWKFRLNLIVYNLNQWTTSYDSNKIEYQIVNSNMLKVRSGGLIFHVSPKSFKPVYRQSLELDNLVLELQSELTDFFCQIERADMFVSDIMSTYVLFWLSSVADGYYYAFSDEMAQFPRSVRITQIITFVFISIVSVSLFKLHRCTTKTYRMICSLMSYDQSKYKCGFIKVLEFYTTRNRSTYTVFREYPFTITTYLSIIGYTFSCFLMVESLFRKR